MRTAFLLPVVGVVVVVFIGCPGPPAEPGDADGGTDASTTDSGGAIDSGGGSDSGADGGSSGAVLAFDSPRSLDGGDAPGPNGTYNIWSVNADGTGLHPLTQLTAASADASRAAWSPDGTKIAYQSTRALDGSDAENARPPDAGTSMDATNIWVMNADGSGAKPLTRLTLSSCQAPTWSPDGTKILFNSDRPANGTDGHPNTTNSWIMDADGNNQMPLTQFVSTVTSQPSMSPDGSHIVYQSQGALNGSDSMIAADNIWVMNSNVTSPQPLTSYTTAGVYPTDPSWSKDNTTILYYSNALTNGSDGAISASGGHTNIWTVTVASQTKTPLTTFATAGTFLPAYSPDGTHVAYASNGTFDGNDTLNTNNTGNVWVMKADGSAPTALTKNQHVDYDFPVVSWSHDGALLVFSSERNVDGSDSVSPNEVTNLWVMNADGSGVHAVTKTTANGTDCESGVFRP